MALCVQGALRLSPRAVGSRSRSPRTKKRRAEEEARQKKQAQEEELYDQCKMQMDAGVARDKAIKRAVEAAISLASVRQVV